MNMNFNNEQEQEQEWGYADVVHLRDAALQLGVEDIMEMTMGLDESLDDWQMKAVAEQIQEAIEEEQQRLAEEKRKELPACYIGPYAVGVCTICGLRDPNAD